MKKHLLFIVGTLNLGGIETYISRLSKHLSTDLRISVLILSKKYSKNLIDEVNKYSVIYYLNDYINFPFVNKLNLLTINLIFARKQEYADLYKKIGEINFIHSVDSFCNIVGLEFLELNKSIIFTTGVYHSQEYIWDTNHYFRKVQKDFFSILPDKNILHCNTESIIQLNRNLKDSNVIPILIELLRYKDIYPNQRSNKIVSIGRLVDFKTYNKHIINILDEINHLGYNLEYYIYGDGPERFFLEKLAKTKKSKIHFKGSIEYNDLPNILNNAFLFVGSGTSIIEASAGGIPSIIGIESEDRPYTYGLFSELEGFSYNENNLHLEKKEIKDLIINVLEKNDAEYSDISLNHRKKANEFSISGNKIKVINFFTKGEFFSYSFNNLKYKLSLFNWLALNIIKIKNDRKKIYDKEKN